MFGSIGTGEILILLVLALVVLGPEKLPGIARKIGRGLAELRRASYDLQRTLTMEAEDSLPSHRLPPDKDAIARLRARTAVETKTSERGSSAASPAEETSKVPETPVEPLVAEDAPVEPLVAEDAPVEPLVAEDAPVEPPAGEKSSDKSIPSRDAGEKKPVGQPSSSDEEGGGI